MSHCETISTEDRRRASPRCTTTGLDTASLTPAMTAPEFVVAAYPNLGVHEVPDRMRNGSEGQNIARGERSRRLSSEVSRLFDNTKVPSSECRRKDRIAPERRLENTRLRAKPPTPFLRANHVRSTTVKPSRSSNSPPLLPCVRCSVRAESDCIRFDIVNETSERQSDNL
jgi:hypothetical protein